MNMRAMIAVAAAFATTAAMASISDLDSQKYRWDFAKGAYSYIGNGTDPLVTKNASYPSTFKSTVGPNGEGSAVYVEGTTWGEAFGTDDSPTDLNANWTLAMCFRPGGLDNGIALSMGRLNKKSRKEIALCASSDPSKFYIRVIRCPSNSTTPAHEKTIELTGLGNVTNGFHTLVIAHNKPSNSNKGTLYFYWDGVAKGSYTMTTDVPFGNGIQFNCLLTKTSGYGCVRSDNVDASLRSRFYDIRFYTAQFDSNDATAYAAHFPCTYPFRPSAYIEANGCNGIDTGYLAKKNATRYVVDFLYLSPYGQSRIFIAEGDLISALYVQGEKATGNLGWSMNGKTWQGTGVSAGRLRRTAILDAVNKTVAITNYAGRSNFYTKSAAMGTASTDATETTLLLAQRTSGGLPYWNNSKSRIYSFEIDENGAPQRFLVPATNDVGAAGLKDVLTGTFYGDANEEPARPLRFYNGVGCADDYKYEDDALYAKCYAMSADAEKGTVKFGTDAAAGAATAWVPYGGGMTLTATPAEGYVFAGWTGDTWMIKVGSARDAIITVSGDRASQLCAKFERSSSPRTAYAQSGTSEFIGHFDAIENVAAGMHQDAAPTWIDLTGNLTLTKTGAAGFIADAWKADGTSSFKGFSDSVKDALTAKTFTLEMVISHPSSQNNYEYWTYFGAASESRQLVVDLRKNDSPNKLVQGLQYRAAKWNNAAKVPENSGMKWGARQYIAVVCNGDNSATAYYDGTNSFHTISGSTNPSTNQFTVGASYDGLNALYNGSEICAVRMTSRVLTADERMQNWYVDSQRFNLSDSPDGYRFTDGVLEVRVTSGIPGFKFSTDGGTTWLEGEVWTPINAELTLTARYVADPTAAVPFAGLPDGVSASGNSVTFTPSRPYDISAGLPTLDLSANAVWSEAAWQLGGASCTAPASGNVVINLADNAVLTLDGDVALDNLTLNGSGILAIFTGSHTFSATTADMESGACYFVCAGTGENAAIWIGGAAGDLGEATKWLTGAVPGAGTNAIITSITEATLTNNAAFKASSIMFPSCSAAVTIDGDEAISGVAAITNLSSASHVFNVPVYFEGDIQVKQAAMAELDGLTKAHVTFAGGAYAALGCAIENGDFAAVYSRCMFGEYHLASTEDNPWSVSFQGSGKRICLGDNSTLHVPYLNSPRELYIGTGSAVTAAVVSVTANASTEDRICWQNLGEFVITNEFTASGEDGKKNGFAGWNGGTSAANVFKIEKATCTRNDNWSFFFAEGNSASHGTYYFGRGGINFNGGNGYFGFGKDYSGDAQTVRPWYSDFAIETSSGNPTYDIYLYRGITFNTDDENGIGRTITLNARPRFGYAPTFTVSGKGKVLVNSVAYNSAEPTVTVTDTATLAYKPGANLTTNNTTTVNAGATLAVAESGTVALGNLTLADGAALGFNFTEKKSAPVLDLTGKTVTVNGTVNVKASAANGARPKGGTYRLTSGGKFTGATVSLAAGTPAWVKSATVVDGDIVLGVKSSGIIVIVK